jgi:hypothetical protein
MHNVAHYLRINAVQQWFIAIENVYHSTKRIFCHIPQIEIEQFN